MSLKEELIACIKLPNELALIIIECLTEHKKIHKAKTIEYIDVINGIYDGVMTVYKKNILIAKFTYKFGIRDGPYIIYGKETGKYKLDEVVSRRRLN